MPDKPNLSPLLSVSQVADLLQVSRGSVYSLVRSGGLTRVSLPIRKTRFRTEDVEALMQPDDGEDVTR